MPFVPESFAVPQGLTGEGFRLEPLAPRHNDADLAAWTSSIDHIRATPGFADTGWPPVEGMSADENRRDLERHARDFAERTGFTYTVLDDDGDVIGCLYIYPSRDPAHDAQVRSWVRADRAELDRPLHDAVRRWLDEAWPFTRAAYAPR